MAKSLVGDNTEAFGEIKGAFEKAFGQCEKIWGGKLPSVCYDTLNIVREGFDAWEKELTAEPQEQTVSEYVSFYNEQRPHYKLGNKTPVQCENEFFKNI